MAGEQGQRASSAYHGSEGARLVTRPDVPSDGAPESGRRLLAGNVCLPEKLTLTAVA